MRARAVVIATLAGGLCPACEAIDDVSFFHVVGGDGGAGSDALMRTADLAGENDLARAVDGATSEDAAEADGSALDLAAPDLAVAAPDLAPMCVSSLASVGAGDFAIAFTVTTTMGLNTQQPLLNQRAACDNTRSFWAVGVQANGNVSVETGGQSGYAKLSSNTPVNNGSAHRVLVQRQNAMLLIAIDGKGDAGPLPSGSVLAMLPPLEIDKESACNVVAQGVMVTDLCLTIP